MSLKPRARKAKKNTRPPRPLVDLSPARQEEIAAIALLGIAVLTMLGALRLGGGSLLNDWGFFLRAVFGWGAWVAPFFFGGLGLWLLLDSLDLRPEIGFERPIGFTVLFLLALAFLHLFVVRETTAEIAISKGLGGGFIGDSIDRLLIQLIDFPGAIVVLLVLLAVALILLFNVPLAELLARSVRSLQSLANVGQSLPRVKLNPAPRINPGRALRPKLGPPASAPAAERAAPRNQGDMTRPPARHPETEGLDGNERPLPAEPSRPAVAARIIGGAPAVTIHREWRLPEIGEILEESVEQEISANEIRTKVRQIEETLTHFGVPAKVIEVNQGPTITQFGVEPGFVEQRSSDGKSRRTKVKVSRIASLQHDLELALAASPIRVEAPVPGKAVVGIEVPNSQISRVSLRGVMEAEEFRKHRSKLKIALGQDVSGQPIVGDLASMPHLLIAGATGSGKSVCINALIACLICDNTPSELQFIMVDPKRVELTSFNGIPHLLNPVVVDMQQAVAALKYAVHEMDRRFRIFAKHGARNLEGYQKIIEEHPEAERVPFLLIVVDELADLMMVAAEEVERTITRLAQMARATGIHLVLATQRPSVDVVTGLIKANFPSRISFAVTSQIDSRVVLDTPGAEKLLGRGDMLYMASDSSKLVRLQGVFVSDRELERLVTFWKGSGPEQTGIPISASPAAGGSGQVGLVPVVGAPTLRQEPLWEVKTKDPGEDALLEQAIQTVQQSDRASVSLLQRKLRIGYSRAAKLIEQLEAKGYVGPDEGATKGRAVLVKAGGNAPVAHEFHQSGDDSFDDWTDEDWADLDKA